MSADRRKLQCVVFLEGPGVASATPSAVEHASGRVVKADPTLLLATFDRPGRAIACVGRLLQAGTGLRAGIDTGDVGQDRGDLAGLTVHIARRLSQAAANGTACVSARTVRLAGADGLPPPEPLELRGVAAAVSTTVLSGPVPVTDEPLAAIVVTDLVGSTALRSRLGDEVADELFREHERMLSVLAAGHHGTVLKRTGDGLELQFSSVVEAAAAALAFQRATVDHPSLALRVGLEIGGVDAATTLCDRGPAGRPLVGPEAADVLGANPGFAFDPVPEGHLLRAVEGDVVLPLPPAYTGGVPSVFVGRDAELERLERWLDATRAGGEHSLLLLGPAGIGKSRLVRETALRAHASGCRVLLGRCDEQPLTLYQPFVEAIGQYVDTARVDELAVHAPSVPHLVLLAPRLGDRLPGLSVRLSDNPEEDRFRLFEAVGSFLTGIARSAPVLLVLEDLHWVDGSSLQMLRHLLRTAAGSGLAVLVTARSGEMGPNHSLTAMIAEQQAANRLQRLELSGLDPQAVGRLVAERLGRHALALEEAVIERTDGNPFFVLELTKDVEAAGTSSIGVPAGVRDVVTRRLARLEATTRKLLALAGLAGREFDRALIERAAGVSTLDALDALEEAVDAEVLSAVPGSPGRYRFTHALIRDAVEAGIGEDRAAMLHLRLGIALEQLDETASAELSRHFHAAGAGGDPERAVRYAMLTGGRARELSAHAVAARQYERALTALSWRGGAADEQRADLLLELSSACLAAGERYAGREAAERAAAIARELGDQERLARAALWAESSWTPAGSSDPDAVALLSEAVQLVPGPGDALRARVLAAQAMQSFYLDPEAAERLSADAVDLARRAGDDVALGRALHAHTFTLRGLPSSLDARLAQTAELLELALRRGDREQESLARLWRAAFLIEVGDLAAFDREVVHLVAAAEGTRRPLVTYWALRSRSMRALMVGDFAEVERLLPDVLRAGEQATESNAPLQVLAQRVMLAYARGDTRDIVEELRRRDYAPRLGWAVLRSMLLVEVGELSEAAAIVEEVVADDFAAVPPDAFAPLVLGMAADVVASLGRADLAEPLRRRLHPDVGATFTVPTGTCYIGPVAFFLGRLETTLGSFGEALEHQLRALAQVEALEARPLAARVHLATAAAHAGLGADAEARRHAERALHLAVALGLPFVERDARAALDGVGTAR